MDGYKTEIKEASWDVSKKERIQLDSAPKTGIDEATSGGDVLRIAVSGYVVMGIHNPKAERVDYDILLIRDYDGTIYSTGSPSFIDTFKNIYSQMVDGSDDEDWKLVCYRMPSKNHAGKDFLTCTVE